LAERDAIGGVCLNRGCIPTKALLSDIEGLLWIKRAAKSGLIDCEPGIRFRALMDRKNQVVDGLVGNLTEHMRSLGVEIHWRRASAIAPDEIALEKGDRIGAERLFISTGSKPMIPPISGIDSPLVVDSTGILGLEKVPNRLGVIGGGIIGQEFAAIFSALGSKVTVFEAMESILPSVDRDIAKRYANLARGKGIKIVTSAFIRSMTETSAGLRLEYEKGAKELTEEVDLALISVGRTPNLEEEALGELDLETDNRALAVNEYLMTSVEGVYAGGDVIGRQMLAHVAAYHGEYVAESLKESRGPCNDDPVPSCVFTHPQIAWVGPSEEELKESGAHYRTSLFPLSASGKARAGGDTRGWLKLIEDTESGRLLSAIFLGPSVSELISEMTMAIKRGFTAADVVEVIHPHPTLSESMRESAMGFLDGPIHSAGRVKAYP
jgi:dihydrolipoamide dehydrogenase